MKIITDSLYSGFKDKEFVVFDIETTGLYFEFFDEPIEIAAVKINKEREISDIFHVYILPKKPISEEIEKLTGINEEIILANHHVSRKEAIEGFSNFIRDCIPVAHNAMFDVNFLNFYLNQYKQALITDYICTMQSYREILKEFPRTKGTPAPKTNLSSMCDFFEEVNEHAHSAIEDTKATAKCFIKILNEKRAISFNKIEKVEAYENFKKRILKSNICTSIKYDITSVFNKDPSVGTLSDTTKKKIKEMLSEGKSFEEISSVINIEKGYVEGVFLEWVNPINKIKYPQISGLDPNTDKTIKEILAINNWNVDEACNSVKRMCGFPADKIKFLYVEKMYSKYTKFEYHDGELDFYFENLRDVEETCTELNISSTAFIYFLSKWLTRNTDNISIWIPLIQKYILKKEEYERMIKCKKETPDIYEEKCKLLTKKQIDRIKNTEMLMFCLNY